MISGSRSSSCSSLSLGSSARGRHRRPSPGPPVIPAAPPTHRPGLGWPRSPWSDSYGTGLARGAGRQGQGRHPLAHAGSSGGGRRAGWAGRRCRRVRGWSRYTRSAGRGRGRRRGRCCGAWRRSRAGMRCHGGAQLWPGSRGSVRLSCTRGSLGLSRWTLRVWSRGHLPCATVPVLGPGGFHQGGGCL